LVIFFIGTSAAFVIRPTQVHLPASSRISLPQGSKSTGSSEGIKSIDRVDVVVLIGKDVSTDEVASNVRHSLR